jgi:carboxylesterase
MKNFTFPGLISSSRKRWAAAALTVLITVIGCEINDSECNRECQDGFWMDSGLSEDPCGDTTNTTCLVSRRFPAPTDSDKANKHVIIAVHGFTASTYEWQEFKTFAEGDTANGHGRMLISLVLLGGHGVNLDAFQKSGWKDWGAPIMAEFDSLKSRGYKNISFACASTGCALLMQYIQEGLLDTGLAPKGIYMIDPIVTPSSKLLSLVNLVGPILGNSPNPGTDTENVHWYVNRPHEDLQQLYELTNRIKNELETGFDLPKKTECKVYKSKHDNSSDPIGALLIYKGMRMWDGSRIEAELYDSRLHVMTRLAGRDTASVSRADTVLQLAIFSEILKKEDLAAPKAKAP